MCLQRGFVGCTWGKGGWGPCGAEQFRACLVQLSAASPPPAASPSGWAACATARASGMGGVGGGNCCCATTSAAAGPAGAQHAYSFRPAAGAPVGMPCPPGWMHLFLGGQRCKPLGPCRAYQGGEAARRACALWDQGAAASIHTRLAARVTPVHARTHAHTQEGPGAAAAGAAHKAGAPSQTAARQSHRVSFCSCAGLAGR
jgi:hypothetical protein